MRIAVLEDDRDQADLLTAWLSDAGHQSQVFGDGKSLVRAYLKDSFDLVFLDWMVPGASGMEVLKHLRGHLDAKLPIIFVTQRDAEKDIVEALENGADDYMVKPIRMAETIARINAIARRTGFAGTDANEIVEYPPFVLNPHIREVSAHGKVIEMTQKEFELTSFMFRNLGRIISRGHLLEMVWGTSAKINTRTVDTHISRLRHKLNLDNEPNWRLTSVYRHGYRLENI